MQAIEHSGAERMPEIFNPKRLKTLLDGPEVKEVRVFKIKKGMKINIEGNLYKVIAARPNGKITLKLLSDQERGRKTA